MPRTESANQQIRDERRDHILATAATLIADHGLASLKIGDLAAAAGMSQGLFYRYFANKDEVFIALVDQAATELTNLMQEGLAGAGPPFQQLVVLTEYLLASLRQHPRRHQLILQGLAQPGPAQSRVQAAVAILTRDLGALIRAGQRAGTIVQGDPVQLLDLYRACLLGLASSVLFFGAAEADRLPTAAMIVRMFTP
ncbi:MAG: TetR/AcrR family transcriptional regulator [Roseiflexaceae bacterium]